MQLQSEQSIESRKVLFSFIPASGFDPDEAEQKEKDDLARKREGIFHGENEVEENGLKKTYFVVEDSETGIVYDEIESSCVQFID